MKRRLVPILIVSLAANGVLLGIEGNAARVVPPAIVAAESAPQSVPRKAEPAECVDDMVTHDLKVSQDRIRTLEIRVAELQAERAAGGDAVALKQLLRSNADLRTKLRALVGLGRDDLLAALQIVALTKVSSAEARELLASESDPAILTVLTRALSWGGGGAIQMKTLAEELPPLLDILARGEPAERRTAAAALLARQWVDQRTAAWAAALESALRTDPDPRVAGEIAEGLHYFAKAPEGNMVDALRAASERLGAGPERLRVLKALAERTVQGDGGRGLVDRWFAASDPALREELSRALGLAAWLSGPPKDPDLAGPMAERKTRFLAMFEGTHEPDGRLCLIGGAFNRLDLIPGDAREAETFFRELALREPVANRREQLSRFADEVRQGLDPRSEEARGRIQSWR